MGGNRAGASPAPAVLSCQSKKCGPYALYQSGESFTIGRRVVAYVIRWTNDYMVIELPVITAILIITLMMSLMTDYIGVHTVLGAFVAGILVGESPILSKHIEEQLRGLIVAMFAPVFFGVAGLEILIGVQPAEHRAACGAEE